MTGKTLIGMAFATGCALTFTVPPAKAQMPMDAQALTNAPQASAGDHGHWSASRNNAESAQYERLLRTNPGFRRARIDKECGPITDAQLRQSCLASFDHHDPSMGSGDHMMTGTTGIPVPSAAGMDAYSSPTNQGDYRIR